MATLATAATRDGAAGRNPVFELGPGVHECWYPVALSSEVGVGEVIGREIGEDRLVIYRGEDGVVRAMSAFCKHMGADLGVGGQVVGNSIRCPFHHWSYGQEGQCNHIPAGDEIPQRARLFRFASAEQFGLIWVFFGEKPLYQLQTFEDFDEDKHVARSYEIQLSDKLNSEPWLSTTNVFDIVHLKFLHGVNIVDSAIEELDPYRRRMQWRADLGDKAVGGLNMEIYVYGMNSLRTQGEQGGRLKWYIAASVPSVRVGTKFFITIITSKGEGAEAFLDQQVSLHTQILDEDLPVLNNMRYDELLLVPSDKALTRFLKAVRKYPRVSMKQLERSVVSDSRTYPGHL